MLNYWYLLLLVTVTSDTIKGQVTHVRTHNAKYAVQAQHVWHAHHLTY